MDALTDADAFSPPGEFDAEALEAWAAWDAEHGILEQAPDISKLFDVSH